MTTFRHLAPRRDGYAPIADYGLIGDTRTGALVARDGSIDWLCLPDFDSPSVFAAILDRKRGGRFQIAPVGEAQVARRYLDDSAILETTFRTAGGTFRLTDFMPIAEAATPRRIRPGREVLRLIEVVEGAPEIAVTYAPRLHYGDRVPRLRERGPGVWSYSDSRAHMLLQSELPLDLTAEGTLQGRVTLAAGERRVLALSHDHKTAGVLPAVGPGCWDDRDATCAWWSDFWAAADYRGPFREAVARSMVTLRLLNFSLSGAVIAAPTMGLPEAIGGTRNWDYRYCWLRDASFILRAFLTLGYAQEGRAFFRWLIHTTQLSAPRLGVLYDLFGRHGPGERRADSLEGYRGSGPVWVGNGAADQLQLDVYGEVLTAARLYVDAGAELGPFERRRLRHFADVVCESWTLPDNAIWEFRGARKHYTHSKAMCWAALDATVALCDCGALGADPAPYIRERDAIRADVLSSAWNEERGCFTGAYGQPYTDAALMLLPRMGIVDASDPRMIATFEAIEADLSHGPHLKRYPDGVDGFASSEGYFTACGFWAADCLARRGDAAGARARIEALLSEANDLGLMSEQFDPAAGAMLGNFPQAFSHAGLVNAAISLDRAERGRTRDAA